MVNRAAEFFAQSPIDGKRGDRDYRVQRDRVNAAETGRARQFVDVDQTDTTVPGDFSDDNKQMFIDWNRMELYQLQRGEGECAV